MLKLVLLTALAVLQTDAQDTAIFRDEQLRLEFAHPKTWTIDKRQRDITTLSFPIQDSTDRASLQITRAVYRSEPEVWQLVQLRANQQLKREVVRQWDQQILGVPMLLTKISFVDKGVQMNTLTGLLYTATPVKMLFRLTGPSSDFDKVEYEFQQAIQTLRTVDDSTLKPEDPDRPADTPVKAKPTQSNERAAVGPPKKVTFDDKPVSQQAVQGPVTVPITVSGRALQVRLSQGWSADEPKENHLVLHHPKLSNPLKVDLYAIADSDPVRTALFNQASDSLKQYSKVERRYDVADKASRGGMTLNAVWRRGETKDGRLLALDASVTGQDHYLLVSYRLDQPGAFDADKKIVDDLLEVISVAPAP